MISATSRTERATPNGTSVAAISARCIASARAVFSPSLLRGRLAILAGPGDFALSTQIMISLGAGIYDVVATATFGDRRRVVQAEVIRQPGMARVRFWRRLPG